MYKFRDVEREVEQAVRAGREMRQRLALLNESGFLSPVVKGTLITAAERLARCAEQARFDEPPSDMIDEEWAHPAIRLLRSALATVGLRAAQPPRDLKDWARDLELALDDFDVAKARFDAEIER